MKFKLTREQKELFKPCVALQDDEHWAVYIYLMRSQTVTLTEAREEFDSTYWEMRPILDDLIRAGLADQFVMKCEDRMNLDKRYYRVSIPGLRFYYLIMDSLLPRRLL